jgi:hypothetical protein
MRRSKNSIYPAKPLAVLVLLAAIGCGAPAPVIPPVQPAPVTYMAPKISGLTLGDTPYEAALTFDDLAKPLPTFSLSTYQVSNEQAGQQVFDAGTVNSLDRGLLDLTLTYQSNGVTGGEIDPPQPQAGWALELAGQAGGLVAINGQPPLPMTAAQSCPGSATQTYEFLTLPAPLTTAGASAGGQWNPNLDAAYGSVDISANADTVNLANLQQFTLPTSGKPGAPAAKPISPATGLCSSGYYGNTVLIPGSINITNPGNGQQVPPYAILSIGPTGLLLESSGNPSISPDPTNALPYEDVMGAGMGAIGFPKPASPVSTPALFAAQYQGFFYGTGNSSQPTGWTSLIASFGFATLPTNCKTAVAPEPTAGTLIYGGDFANNDPTSVQSTGGYSRCDAGIDLGTEDPDNNGLYPNAKVYFGSLFAGNQLGSKYPFPAIAIASQLNGKFAIFVLGVDTTGSPQQAWSIYLLQSN